MNKLSKQTVLITAIIVAVLGVFIIRGFLSSNRKQTSSVPSIKTLQPQSKIILDKKGFNPQTTTIKAGQRVMWINRSGETATVNSNPHPTNDAYKDLNLGEFKDGSTLQLVFPKPGKYGFHNFLKPEEKGQIVVE